MAMRVRKGDYTIEADTVDELREVLAILGLNVGTTAKTERVSLKAVEPVPGDGTWSVKDMEALATGIKDKGSQVILALWESPEGLTREELCKMIGVELGALGGVLASPSRSMAKLGIPYEGWLVKVTESRQGKEERIYRLAPTFRQAVDSCSEFVKRLKKVKKQQPLFS